MLVRLAEASWAVPEGSGLQKDYQLQAGKIVKARRGDQEARAEARVLLQHLPSPRSLFCSRFKPKKRAGFSAYPLVSGRRAW